MKKSIFLACWLFFFSLFVSVYAFAETLQGSAFGINPLYEKQVDLGQISAAASGLRGAITPVVCYNTDCYVATLEDFLTRREATFSIHFIAQDISLPFSLVEGFIHDGFTLMKDVDGGYLYTSLVDWNMSWSGGDNDVTIEFSVRYDTTYAQELEIADRVNQILAQITSAGMNDEEKAKEIHDWVVRNVAYDNSLQKHSIYDALFSGSAVCEGYALLMYKMYSFAGIRALIVSGIGDGEAHAWNLVWLCSAWFHVDATWDDPVPDVPGRVLYNYYNLSDNQMAQDHAWQYMPAASTVYAEGICDNTPDYAYTYYVPYLSNDSASARWTGVALANAENMGADVRIICYGMNGGAPLVQKEEDLPALGQASFPAVTPSEVDGWIKIESTRKLDGLALIGQSNPPLLFDMDMKSSLHQKFLLAHMAADSDDWDSLVMACNPNNVMADMTYNYYDQAGQMVTSRTSSIPAGGSVQDNLYTVFGQRLVGSVVIESSQPITAFMLYNSKTTGWRAGLSALPLD